MLYADRTQKAKTKRIISLVISLLAAALAVFVYYYIFLPPINPFSKSFWTFLAFIFIVFSISLGAFNFNIILKLITSNTKNGGFTQVLKKNKRYTVLYALIVLPIAVIILGGIISSTVFNAKNYASIITVEERDFASDMPQTTEIKNIALMDTDSARMLGDRKLGALSNVVSQYIVSNDYTQINYHGIPMKITHLEYDGFFKWIGNRSSGIPGYIMVNTLENTAEYYELEKGIKYSQSGFFSDDLMRRIRFDYPTKIFDMNAVTFEIDEDGNAFYCISCYSPQVGLFGAYDVTELIIFNPIDGSSEIYDIEKVPRWVDIVFDGDLACEKYDWQGIYSGGFINSIIGNKGCKQTTDDFGYLMFDDDVWYFTGITSITSDASNIGFILSNARTGEYRFYPVIGAEEHSAMNAAEGEVQEKEYVASFPSLVNISGVPTYIMVLKDNHGLVKLYALVNVRQYTMVATGETQTEAVNAYLKMLSDTGIDTQDPDNVIEKTVTVSNIQFLNMNGVTYAYITSDENEVFKMEFNEKNEAVILLAPSDKIKIKYVISDNNNINLISEWTTSSGGE